MFSYFKGGIKDCKPEKKITIERLVKEIKRNNTEVIQKIRALDHSDIDYKSKKNTMKRALPNITPNCTVKYRNDDGLIEFSGYVYLDVDNVEDVNKEKARLVDRYAGLISLMSISSSGRALSILVKIENELTVQNFHSVRRYLCEHVFHELVLDPNPSAISNAWYIPYDPDCYYNPSSSIEVPEEYLEHECYKEKGANVPINNILSDIGTNAPFQVRSIRIEEVFSALRFRTEVEVKNKVFDIRPEDYCEVYLNPHYLIPDGRKTGIFTQTIHNLLYLNPDVEHDYILSYILWLNQKRTVTSAARKDVIRLFNNIIKKIKQGGELKPKLRTVYFHCRKNTIDAHTRKWLSRNYVNLYKAQQVIHKISIAKQVISLQKSANVSINNSSTDIGRNAPTYRVTQVEVCRVINEEAEKNGTKGMGIRTIKKYWHLEPIDIDALVLKENNNLEITYISVEDKAA